MTMTTYTILLGGDLVPTLRLKAQIADTPVIAADGGMRHAARLGLEPLLWVGDFDSADAQDIAAYARVPRLVFKPGKDKTDGEIAVQEACKRGAKRLVLCGALGGGRTDHALLHMTLAAVLLEKKIPVLLTGGKEEGWPLVAGSYEFDFPQGSLFSIVAFSAMEGLRIHGARWTLDHTTLAFGSSLTLSNEVTGRLSVSLEQGRGILLVQPVV
ncbi:MAG: Thiamine pyrophosphokinase [Candidatus Tokpelaia hoelldobleri]|uniref:Thiamine diphosphokinase n=1 Tax=Candidatus Tokpelaia hoelldobleri TaxID=1902579 RepID=A0A1U9JT32_9HYPH|nr:MAG: Thiamine pyrophosphokinase [Candidatus Tokpelaia hoelldoblerii]